MIQDQITTITTIIITITTIITIHYQLSNPNNLWMKFINRSD
jgi:hypothetical protein